MSWREPLAVLVGGTLGTALRLAIDGALPHGDAEFALGTLLINVAGSFVLGLLAASLWVRPSTPAWLRAGLGVGVLGAFTTFSAVAVSVVAMARDGGGMLALAYLAASFALGLAAALAGLLAGRRISRSAPAAGPTGSE